MRVIIRQLVTIYFSIFLYAAELFDYKFPLCVTMKLKKFVHSRIFGPTKDATLYRHTLASAFGTSYIALHCCNVVSSIMLIWYESNCKYCALPKIRDTSLRIRKRGSSSRSHAAFRDVLSTVDRKSIVITKNNIRKKRNLKLCFSTIQIFFSCSRSFFFPFLGE